MLRHVAPCCAMLRHAAPCCAMLRHAAPCCALLGYTLLWLTVECFAMLFQLSHGMPTFT
jgi:hypothetical protein